MPPWPADTLRIDQVKNWALSAGAPFLMTVDISEMSGSRASTTAVHTSVVTRRSLAFRVPSTRWDNSWIMAAKMAQPAMTPSAMPRPRPQATIAATTTAAAPTASCTRC